VIQVGQGKGLSLTETIQQMFKEDGVASFYSGLGYVLVSLGVSNFVYFYSNNLLKVIVKRTTGQKSVTVFQNLFIASLAGVINVLTTCPLWVANTRLRLQRSDSSKGGNGHGGGNGEKPKTKPYDGMMDALSRIAEEEGVLSLWNGAQASLILVSNPTIHFVVYDKVIAIMSARAKELGRKYLNSFEIFVAGAIAKTCATILTYPIQLAQTRLRHVSSKKKEGEAAREDAYANTLDVLIRIFSKDGFLGWFAGLNVKVVQTVLTAAFQFLCYEQIKNLIFAVMAPAKLQSAAGGGGHGGGA